MKFIVLILMLITQLFSNEASYNRGETLYFSRGCNSCHGPSAEGSSSYPRLANKKQNFLLKKLEYFRIGKVDSVSKEMMSQFARQLSDKDINDLVVFFSKHKNVEIDDVSDDILGGFGS